MNNQVHPVTHVIFDMDGLLLDTEPLYMKAIGRICNKYGKEITEEARTKGMGTTAIDTAKVYVKYCNLPISVDQFLEETEEMYMKVFSEHVELLPGASKLVKHLKEHNVPIAIATSSKNSTFKLKSMHHPEFFKQFTHVVLGSDDPEVRNGKPSPDIFLVAAKRFAQPPEDMKNVLVFEDSANGVKAGMAAGMQVVWVPAMDTDTSSAEATLIIPSLEKFVPELFSLPPY